MGNIDTWLAAGYVAMLITLAYASVIDIATYQVPYSIYYILGIIVLFVGIRHPLLSLLGIIVVTFVEMMLLVIVHGGIGGGDLWVLILCGGILGYEKCLIAWLIAILIQLIDLTYNRIKFGKNRPKGYPFVPCIWLGVSIALTL